MKRSQIVALLLTVLTASAVLGQARLLPPSVTNMDDATKTEQPAPSIPTRPRSAILQPPTSLPAENDAQADVPANGPPHQMYGRTPAHGTKTAGEFQGAPLAQPPVSQVVLLAPEVRGPLGRLWAEVDYLLWFNDGDNPPPLLTTSPAGTPISKAGVLRQPGTAVLAGGRQFNDDARSGVRVNVGYWFDSLQTFGIQAGGFWLENNNSAQAFASNGSVILARPFFDVTTGNQSAALIAFPGISAGTALVTAHSSLAGWDIAFRQNAWCSPRGRIDWLLGYRQLRLADQLDIEEQSTVIGGVLPAGTQLLSVDRFNTTNEFYGAEFGLVGEYHYCRWVFEGLMKLEAGWNVSHVNINGTTLTGGSALSGGFLALPTNIGVYRRTEATLIPEFGLNVAYDVNSHLRLRGGYSFLYWDQVFRPGQQIALGINPNLVPPAVGGGPARPLATHEETDIFIHGLNFGFEVRY